MNFTQEEKRRHLYIVGMTGTGKSTLLKSLMLRDNSFALIDPHGDLAEAIADTLPPERTIYLNPLDPTHAVGFNPLEHVPVLERSIVTASIVSSFKGIWADSWGPRLEYILGNAIRLLSDNNATLLHIPLVLTDKVYRTRCLRRATDPFNRYFWEKEFERYPDKFKLEAIAPIQNKIGQLVGNPHIRAILGQPSTLKPDEVMNDGKILVANLSKRMGTEPSHLLGALITSAFFQAAERRGTIPESERKDFTLYVDEFQNFGTDAFAAIFSEARKWRLSLVVANQFIGQLPESLKFAVLGNAGTLASFRVGSEDAGLLTKELGLGNPRVLMDLSNHEFWIKRLRDGVPTEPALVKTELLSPQGGGLKKVIAATRARYSRPRKVLEAQFARLYA